MTLPRILIGGAMAVLILFAAAVGGWWILVREDASLATNAPAIPVDLKKTPASTGSGAGQTFTIISDRSEAAYFADEKLASLPLPSTAKGSTKDVSGEFHLTADGFDLDVSKPTTFAVDLTTLTSDKDLRDRRVQNLGLETAKFPTATFTAARVVGFDKSLPADQEQDLQLSGTLDLHGVKKDVTWDVKARREGDVITALATLKFKFADFGIPILNIADFVSVQDSVTLQVQVVAQAS